MQVPATQTAVAPFTRDSDMVMDPEVLLDEPLLEADLQRAGFIPGRGERSLGLGGVEPALVDLNVTLAARLLPATTRCFRLPESGKWYGHQTEQTS